MRAVAKKGEGQEKMHSGNAQGVCGVGGVVKSPPLP